MLTSSKCWRHETWQPMYPSLVNGQLKSSCFRVLLIIKIIYQMPTLALLQTSMTTKCEIGSLCLPSFFLDGGHTTHTSLVSPLSNLLSPLYIFSLPPWPHSSLMPSLSLSLPPSPSSLLILFYSQNPLLKCIIMLYKIINDMIYYKLFINMYVLCLNIKINNSISCVWIL